MWSGEVVELLPLGQFSVQVDITRVAEKLVELLLIRSVGSFDFAVKLRRAGLARLLPPAAPLQPRLATPRCSSGFFRRIM